MRFLSADYLFTLKDEPIKNGVIQVDNSAIFCYKYMTKLFIDFSYLLLNKLDVFL